MTDRLTWQEKFAAILAFAPDATLNMRKPGDWYVLAGMSIGGTGVLIGTYGNGGEPEEAVNDHWHIFTSIKPTEYVVYSRDGGNRRARWNGFMWADVSKEEAERLIEGAIR